MFHPDGDSDENEVEEGHWCAVDNVLSVHVNIEDGDIKGTASEEGRYQIVDDSLLWAGTAPLIFRDSGEGENGTWSSSFRVEEDWEGAYEHGWIEQERTLTLTGGAFTFDDAETEWWENEGEEEYSVQAEGTFTVTDSNVSLTTTHEDGEELETDDQYLMTACSVVGLEVFYFSRFDADCESASVEDCVFKKQ